MRTNKGYKIEESMKKWFKGEDHNSDCVDFQTKTSLYEVKSCRLFLDCVNGNNKRQWKNHPHKKIHTLQLGRFHIKIHNHKKLKLKAEKENKIPKYIFVIVIGKQKIWRLKSWDEIDKLLDKEKRQEQIRIKQLFNEPVED